MKGFGRPSGSEAIKIDGLVAHFSQNRPLFKNLLNSLVSTLREDEELAGAIHSVRSRVKDVEHLRAKLHRKARDARAAGKAFDIQPGNLFEKINDLAGCRIIYLHTAQFRQIHKRLAEILDEYGYAVIEGPTARTWDDESRQIFRAEGIATADSPSLYTSVHYVVMANQRTKITCEVQARTLAEELWGEVDHMVNYPDQSGSMPCREQIKALARLTSGCTRLVDSIFATQEEFVSRAAEVARPAGARRAPKPAGRGRGRGGAR